MRICIGQLNGPDRVRALTYSLMLHDIQVEVCRIVALSAETAISLYSQP